MRSELEQPGRVKSIEATVGGDELETLRVLHVRPAEVAPLPWEIVVDMVSFGVQAVARRLGRQLPDVRFRLITNPHTDGIEGGHFGLLSGAVAKAEQILARQVE